VLLFCGLAGAALAQTKPAAPAEKFADNDCVQCHRDLPGRSAEIVALEWKHSVHYDANVGCDGCHGGNPALKRAQFASDDAFKKAAHQERSPEFLLINREQELASPARGRSISYFCGKCHAQIKEHHLGSPHGEFGDPTCLYCHTEGTKTHLIQHPTPDIIDSRTRAEGGHCSPCHKAATMLTVARIHTIMVDSEAQIKTTEKLYALLEADGYRNLELESLTHHAKEVRSGLRQAFHSFNLRDISTYATEIQGAADRTSATYDLVQRLRQTQRQQTVIGACAVALLLFFAGFLVLYKKAFLH
jgi:hypothetical protein